MNKLEKALLLSEKVPPHLQRLLLENTAYSQSDDVEAVFDRLAYRKRNSVRDILENGIKKVPINKDVVVLKGEFGCRDIHGDFGTIYKEFSDETLSAHIAVLCDGRSGGSSFSIQNYRGHLIIAYNRHQQQGTRGNLGHGDALVMLESDIPYGGDLTPLIQAFPSKVPDGLRTRTNWDKPLVWSEGGMEIQEKDLLLQNILRVFEGKPLILPKSTDISYIGAFLLDVYSFLPLQLRSKFGARVKKSQFGVIETNGNANGIGKNDAFGHLLIEEVIKIKEILEEILGIDGIKYIEFTLNKEILLASIVQLLIHNPKFLSPESLVAIYSIGGFGIEILVCIWKELVIKIGLGEKVSGEDIQVFGAISYDISILMKSKDTDNFLENLNDTMLSNLYLVCKKDGILKKGQIVRILIDKLPRGIEDGSFGSILEEALGFKSFLQYINSLPESQFKMLTEHVKSHGAKKDYKDLVLKRIGFPGNLLLKGKIREL